MLSPPYRDVSKLIRSGLHATRTGIYDLLTKATASHSVRRSILVLCFIK